MLHQSANLSNQINADIKATLQQAVDNYFKTATYLPAQTKYQQQFTFTLVIDKSSQKIFDFPTQEKPLYEYLGTEINTILANQNAMQLTTLKKVAKQYLAQPDQKQPIENFLIAAKNNNIDKINEFFLTLFNTKNGLETLLYLSMPTTFTTFLINDNYTAIGRKGIKTPFVFVDIQLNFNQVIDDNLPAIVTNLKALIS